MAVTMKDVRAALDPEEPNYPQATKLGAAALPHLEALVDSADAMLAAKATYLASLIKDARAAAVVAKAARSDLPTVRVAAAAAAANLPAAAASEVLVDLVGDADAGVRRVAKASKPDKPSARLAERLDELDGAEAVEAPAGLPDTALPVGGLMPGETPTAVPGVTSATMPGERPGSMTGEQPKMPGE